jgi:hypothetical protein
VPLSAGDREQITLDHLRLVTYLATSYRAAARRARVQWDDLIQEGRLALVLAAADFDPVRFPRIQFSTYAGVWICRALARACNVRPDLTGLDPDRIAAKRRPPTLVPIFPVVAYDPSSVCPHHGPIARESRLVCMICHQSGVDHYAVFDRDPATDPKPEKKPAPKTAGRETRRQRRLRIFGTSA